ncbi:DUF1804 family protein [Halomonas titanicae]|uniref:DUF1804 family protein n=1 Tax=Vreelandella titanicae TaxID=664683 RepID=UPI001F32D9E5|nr:DUF1804 family protein [Halomonas titanicae]MCE7520420.1 DUF1804 family protein [Halomonas titanicae]
MPNQNVNTKARQIIEKVRSDYGYTFEEMAEMCGVATGSIQRWYSTSKAKSDKILPLEELVENNRLPADKIADNLIEIYWHIKRPYTLSNIDLRDMSGRERLSQSVIEDIEEFLFEKGFALISDQDDEGRYVYIIIRKKWITKRTRPADRRTLKEYYCKKVEDEFEEAEGW